MASDVLKVFVSSTSKDLTHFRAAAQRAVLDQNWQPIMMEHFGARPGSTVDECLDEVRRCDIMILIIAHRRGYVPTAEQGGDGVESVTALEFKAARAANIPVLAFLADGSWPGDDWEDEADARKYIRTLRDDLNQIAAIFKDEADEEKRLFRVMIREALVAYREKQIREQTNGASQDQGNQDSLPMAVEDLWDGLVVPFVGTGIFEGGPLSSKALSLALSRDMDAKEPPPLATSAEYLERLGGSRERLVMRFAKVVQEQEKQLDTCAVYDLLARIKEQRFVILTTYDRLLERALDAEGRSYVVIKHVLRSWEGENDGKIMILQKGKAPQLRLAGEVELPPDELVIYRPLGSPFPDDGVSADLEIDTLVVTETDHLTFLGRLENQHTKIPTALSIFMRRPFLFLGYALEAWHYRLVAQVFQQLGQRKRGGSVFAVRKSTSRIEDMAWKRLGVDMIHATAEEFVAAAGRSQETGSIVEGL